MKTRLAHTLGNEAAAALASAMFLDVWRSVTGCFGVQPILATTEFRNFPIDIRDENVWLQGEGDLGARLERIIRRSLREATAAIAVGADSPILTSSHILRAVEALDVNDAVIGRCIDGGFYLLGLRRCPLGLLSELPWSTSTTSQAVMKRLNDNDFKIAQMEILFDVDVMDDLKQLLENISHQPSLAPATWAWHSANKSRLPFT
ncbi:MAG: TIGR04282 family arsenosugar biosynthesis glycosyltransferase [Bryobacteraceae bacterium]